MASFGSLIIVTARCPASRRPSHSRERLIWKGSLLCVNASSALDTSGALLIPLRVGPLQQVLRAGGTQMRTSILHHHFAIDVARRIRDQETREIGQLAMFAGAAERIA